MRLYPKADGHRLCGHWTGAPLEIGVTGHPRDIPPGDAYHYHDYHEFYLILQGRGALKVEGQAVVVEATAVLMVQPGERHRWAWIDPDAGIAWVVIKARSAPNSKIVVPDEA
jgi:mannose-6-phosphate isomerase-like protein (cupin superfamily)